MTERYSKDGERIDVIVNDFYGDTKYMQLFLDANPGLAQTPILASGILMYFPDKPAEDTTVTGGKLW